MTSFRETILNNLREQPLWWCFLPLTVIWIVGMQLPVMEIDAAQYASISAEMHDTRSFLQVFHYGKDYLDKPPLLFWLTTWSFDLFGIHNWSYRLPSMLSLLLGLWAIYHLTIRMYQDQKKAVVATVVYASMQSTFLFMHDIRTDTLLTHLVIFSIWQGVLYLEERRWSTLFGLASGIGLSMLAKGPIGLMVPTIALGAHLWWSKNGNVLRDVKTWLIPLIILAWLSPMLYGLYHQFDLQPEKVVLGRQGVSGIYFYFWEQSFGRITGSSSWENNTGVDYFFINSLWSLLPWTIVFWVALIEELAKMFKYRKENSRSDRAFPLMAFGVLIPFIVFSFAHYKLPHYIFVLAPLQAMLIAPLLVKDHPSKWLVLGQGLILIVLLAGIGGTVWVFPAQWWKWILLAIFSIMSYYLVRKTKWMNQLWKMSLTAMLSMNFWLAIHFYPILMEYQVTSEAIDYIHEHNLPIDYTAFLGVDTYGLYFFAGQKIQYTEHWDPALSQFKYVLSTEDGLKEMNKNSMHFTILKIYKGFPVSRLNAKFLNPKTRNTQYNFAYLVALNQN